MREREEERAVKKQTERGCRKRNTKYKKERLLRQEDRQQRKREREKNCCAPPPTTPHLYLSKESSVLAQELKPLSLRAGARCPGAPASFGAGGCGARLASAKPCFSLRDNCQITVLPNAPTTGGMICALSPPPSLFPFSPLSMTPGDIRADRAPDLLSSVVETQLQVTCLIGPEWWINRVKQTMLLLKWHI